jgi:hypothetical protein
MENFSIDMRNATKCLSEVTFNNSSEVKVVSDTNYSWESGEYSRRSIKLVDKNDKEIRSYNFLCRSMINLGSMFIVICKKEIYLVSQEVIGKKKKVEEVDVSIKFKKIRFNKDFNCICMHDNYLVLSLDNSLENIIEVSKI